MDTKGYQVNISSLPEEDGGGYVAIVPELPGCMADGETPEEALSAVEEAIASWIEVEKEDGGRIPVPIGYKAYSEYSGRIGLRLPKWMHAKTAFAADNEGCSINQFIQNAIAYSLGMIDGKNRTHVESMTIPAIKLKTRVSWGGIYESGNEDYWGSSLISYGNDSDIQLSNSRGYGMITTSDRRI